MELGDASAWGIVGSLIGGGGVWTWLAAVQASRRSAPAEMAEAQAGLAGSQAELVEAISEQTKAFVLELQKDRKDLRAVIAGQSRSIKRLVGRVEQLEGENETCRAEGRQLRQHLGSLEARLRDLGVDLPAADLPGSLLMIENGKTTVLKPVVGSGT